MVEITDMQIDAALERGRIARLNEPRAAAVHYDAKMRRIIVDLTNGCAFAFPPELVQGLETASEEQLSEVAILGPGYGLHWDKLDVDLSIPGLLSGVFGTAAWMARRGGKSTSEAKANAARVNGAKGGRPRKAAIR